MRQLRDGCCTQGWLIIFDQRKKTSWDKKIYKKKEILEGKTITVVGL
jgi:hypothetical protein